MNRKPTTNEAAKIAAQAYEVSDITASYLDCIRMYDEVLNRLYDTFAKHFGEEHTDAHINEAAAAAIPLSNLLFKYMHDSITDNLTNTANTGDKIQI